METFFLKKIYERTVNGDVVGEAAVLHCTARGTWRMCRAIARLLRRPPCTATLHSPRRNSVRSSGQQRLLRPVRDGIVCDFCGQRMRGVVVVVVVVQARAGAAPACAAHVLRPSVLGCSDHYQPLAPWGSPGQGHHPSFCCPRRRILAFGCRTALPTHRSYSIP